MFRNRTKKFYVIRHQQIVLRFERKPGEDLRLANGGEGKLGSFHEQK